MALSRGISVGVGAVVGVADGFMVAVGGGVLVGGMLVAVAVVDGGLLPCSRQGGGRFRRWRIIIPTQQVLPGNKDDDQQDQDSGGASGKHSRGEGAFFRRLSGCRGRLRR